MGYKLKLKTAPWTTSVDWKIRYTQLMKVESDVYNREVCSVLADMVMKETLRPIERHLDIVYYEIWDELDEIDINYDAR